VLVGRGTKNCGARRESLRDAAGGSRRAAPRIARLPFGRRRSQADSGADPITWISGGGAFKEAGRAYQTAR